MTFYPLPINGPFIVEIDYRSDERGGFARTYCKKEFVKIGHTKEFVQLNHSWNHTKGTVRGMHFQKPPFKEIKLIRCIRGAVHDVIVDLRKGSSTFLNHVSVELSALNKKMLYVPEGFAHGFQTLDDNTELLYHHTEFYQPESEAALNYADPLLNIKWPLPVSVISDRDLSHPMLTHSFNGLN